MSESTMNGNINIDHTYADRVKQNVTKQSIVDRSIQSLPDITYGSAYDVTQITWLQQRHGKHGHGDTPDVYMEKPVPPPDGGYGWVVVMAAFCNFNLIGTHMMGFSLLYPSMTEGLDSNYGTVGWVGSVSQAFAFIPGFVYATLVVQAGSRTACMIGSLLAAAGAILSSLAPNVYTLYCTYAIYGSGMGMVYISNVVIVQQYFDRKRGIAVGMAMAGLSSGTITGAVIISMATHHYGWRGALLIMGAVNLHGIAFGALQRPIITRKPSHQQSINQSISQSATTTKKPLLLKKFRPQELGGNSVSETNVSLLHQKGFKPLGSKAIETQKEKSISKLAYSDNHLYPNASPGSKDNSKEHIQTNGMNGYKSADKIMTTSDERDVSTVKVWLKEMFDFSLLKDMRFLCYCVGTFLLNIGMMCFYMHSPSRAKHYGVPAEFLGILPPATGILTISSRIVFGFVSDCPCVDRSIQYSLGILLGAVVEITFVFSTTLPTILMHCMLFGFANGIFLTVQSTVLVDLMSVEKIARSQAILGFFIGTACLLATPFAGFLYDVTNNYNIPFLVTGSVQLLSACLLLTVFLRLKIKQRKTMS